MSQSSLNLQLPVEQMRFKVLGLERDAFTAIVFIVQRPLVGPYRLHTLGLELELGVELL
jgi:hypothetical protein